MCACGLNIISGSRPQRFSFLEKYTSSAFMLVILPLGINYCSLPGNLPYSSSEDDILDFLKLSRGEASVELITDREDPHRRLGFGFVTVPVEKASGVLGLDGAELMGRRIKSEGPPFSTVCFPYADASPPQILCISILGSHCGMHS